VNRPSPTNKVLAIIALVLGLSLLLFGSLAYGQLSDFLQVSYIDVGQGDSILLHASDDTDILIDGGPRSAGATVVAYLQDEGIDDIEVMILTHGDADHVGGLIDVLRSAIPVEAVIYNGQHHTSLTYQEFLTETQKRGLTPTPGQAGQNYTWGPVSASVLNPQTSPTGDQNEDSVVILAVYGDLSFLFTGDIGSDTEQTILETGTLRALTEADILKVPHHGSKYSSSASFLEAVGAELAVISVGADNPYGHPAQETLNRLKDAGARVLRTDQNGTIVVTTNGQTYEVRASFLVFLPMVAVPTPTNTAMPTPTNTAIPTPTNTPSPGPTGNVVITTVFYDGVQGSKEPDEFVEIRNDDTHSIQVSGWTLRDEGNHVFTFPEHVMQPGQVCRIYTNEYHPEWCGFNYGSGSAIWNNSGDCAYLRNSTGTPIDTYCY
jgi:competence protein ComEC